MGTNSMMTAKQAKRDAKRLFRLCLRDGIVDPSHVRIVVEKVLDSKPRGYLALLGHFCKLLSLESAKHTAEIQSAVPLTAELEASVQSRLERVYGQWITSKFVLNRSLIGGMRIKIGNDVYDGSVRHGLDLLEKSFSVVNTNGHQVEG
jgi:F-type H+-transporting ATPase subunit delta